MISVMNAIFGMPNIISPNEMKKQSREKYPTLFRNFKLGYNLALQFGHSMVWSNFHNLLKI